jgi:hypothetical protein
VIEQLNREPRTIYRGKLSLDEFVSRLKVQMRREHRELQHPEGDVAPRVMLYLAERVMEMHLDPGWFDSRGTKDALTESIVKFVRLAPMIGRVTRMGHTPVEYVGLIYGMFRVLVNLEDPEQQEYAKRSELPPGMPMPREHPDREEVVSVMVLDREIVKAYHATIQRHRKRSPRLGPWEDMEMGGWDLPTGLMVDPIREAMR